MRITGLVVLAICAATAVPRSQAPATAGQSRVGTGAISGVVSDGQTGRPVAGALVQLSGGPAPATPGPPTRPRQMTDGSGRFVFQSLVAGSYRVTVTATGYLDWGRGGARDSGYVGSISLQDRQWFGDANIRLQRPASISGTIRDERGEPLVDTPVRILMALRIGGRDQWASGEVTKTDDRGAYRFAGLLPGRYAVQVPSIQITLPKGEVSLWRWRKPNPLPAISAADDVGTMAGYFPVPPPEHGQAYPNTFHPAARSLSAADVMAVDFGDDRRGADVTLVPASSVRISGVVAGPAAAIANLPVRLLAPGNESLSFGGETALTKTDQAGRFVLAQVPQGDYTLVVGRAINEVLMLGARAFELAPELEWGANPFVDRYSGASIAGQPGLFVNAVGMSGDDVTGRVSISVGTEAITGLIVPTTAGVSVSGRALYDGADAPAAGRNGGPSGPMVALNPADGDVTRTIGLSWGGWQFDATTGQRLPPGPTFSFVDVMPGRYRLVDNSNGDYRLVGATWNGRDLFATPLEVTGNGPVTGIVVYLSSKRNSVSGVVRAVDGKPLSAGAVLVFPQDHARWQEPGLSAPLFRNLDVSVSGAFSADNLIPGDYFIAAVPLEDRRRALDIEFLTLLAAQARRVTLDESAKLTIDLRIIGGLK